MCVCVICIMYVYQIQLRGHCYLLLLLNITSSSCTTPVFIVKKKTHSDCVYIQSAYARPQPSLDYLHRRRKEIMAQLEERKVVSPPPFASSPNLAHNYDPNYTQEVRGQNHVRSFVIRLR